jgi:PilZ domain-containing protein
MDNSFRSPITRLRTLIESWIFQTTAPAPDSRERRNTAHCTMDRPVEIRCSGAESSAVVTIMDVSLTGAAVRLPDDITPDHELSELAQGDEIALSGLVAIPLDCWVVARDGAVLRLRFFPEAEARLQTLIGRLAGKSPEPGPLQPETGTRRLRKGLVSALCVLLIVPAVLAWRYLTPADRQDRRPLRPDAPAAALPPDAMGLPGSHAAPHAQVNALIAAPGPASEQPLDAPEPAPQVRTFFLLAVGTEFDARIDGPAGRRGETVEAILEDDIRDTGTGQPYRPAARHAARRGLCRAGARQRLADGHRLEGGDASGRQAAAFCCQDECRGAPG